MGAFDHLIPKEKKGGGSFDHLVPEPNGGGVQDWEPEGYTTGQKVSRVVGQASTGFNDAVANVVGAPVDAVNWAARQLDLPSSDAPVGGSKSIKKGIDYVATLPGRVSDAVEQGSLDPLTEARTSRLEPVNRAERIAYGVGEGTGNALAVLAPAAVVANTARAGTVTQGVANALTTQPGTQVLAGATGGGVTGATDDPLLGAAASLAVPVGASVARGIVSPVRPRLTPQEARLTQAAQAEGITLTPAQQTGSPSLRGIEETMARMPLSNRPMQDAFRTQRDQFNRAVLQRAGIQANDASPETLARGFQDIGQRFDDLATRTVVRPDPQFGADVRRVAHDYGRRLETDVAPVFRSYMDDLEPLMQAIAPGAPGSTLPATQSALNPQITGQVYQTIRSDIATRARETNNLPLRRALNGLVESLDDVMERSTSGALRQEWQDTRRQYQALVTVDQSMRGGTQAGRAAGDIPFSGLTQAVRAGDKTGYARGRGQLNELARVGDYIADKIPNSGTPERLAWQNLLTGGALLGGGMASGIGVPAAAAATALPWGVSRLYNSPAGRAYLTNQLTGQTAFRPLYGSEAVRQLVNPEENALVRGGR